MYPSDVKVETVLIVLEKEERVISQLSPTDHLSVLKVVVDLYYSGVSTVTVVPGSPFDLFVRVCCY